MKARKLVNFFSVVLMILTAISLTTFPAKAQKTTTLQEVTKTSLILFNDSLATPNRMDYYKNPIKLSSLMFRNMLTNEGKIVYDQIYRYAYNRVSKITLSIDITIEDLQFVMEALYNDSPELFWLETGYSYLYSNNIVSQVTLKYNSLANEQNWQAANTAFNKNTKAVLAKAAAQSTLYKKVRYIHDQLTSSIDYTYNSNFNQSIYSAVVLRKTVCAGYAKAFQYYMNMLGIQCTYVTGVANGQDHAWNMVKLGGEFYNMDVTFDDPIGNPSNSYHYQYFNITDNELYKTHVRTGLSKSLPVCKGTKYNYYIYEKLLFSDINSYIKAAISSLSSSKLKKPFSAKFSSADVYSKARTMLVDGSWYSKIATPVANKLGLKQNSLRASYSYNNSSLGLTLQLN